MKFWKIWFQKSKCRSQLLSLLKKQYGFSQSPFLPAQKRFGNHDFFTVFEWELFFEREYSHDIVIAGLLHDAIEWSGITEKKIRAEFGEHITSIILANTRNENIADKKDRIDDLIRRGAQHGREALIVAVADTLDSFKWYTRQNNEGQLQYCMQKADALFRHKPTEENDILFEELKTWKNRILKETPSTSFSQDSSH